MCKGEDRRGFFSRGQEKKKDRVLSTNRNSNKEDTTCTLHSQKTKKPPKDHIIEVNIGNLMIY